MAFPEIDFALAAVPDLHAILAEMRERGPVAVICYHGQPAWLILGHKEVTAAFADDSLFPSEAFYTLWAAPTMGRTLQCMGGEEHRAYRALINAAFRPSVMKRSVETLLSPLANELIDRFVADGEAELIEAFTHRYPATIITRMLGIPVADDELFLRWALDLINYPWDPEGALAASRAFTEYLEPLVADRRANPGEDILSELARVEVDGRRLSDEEIYSFVRLLFPAGSDTTFKALGSHFYAILTHPEVEATLRADPSRAAAAVSESLRWEGPIALQPRMSGVATQWGGVEIPADSPMLFGITSANRDPSVFPEPNRYDPSRSQRGMLSFGHGEHFCLGSHLARREMEVATKVVLERLPGLRLADPDAVEIIGSVLRGPRELHVEFDAGDA
jgi:cytochrome P450